MAELHLLRPWWLLAVPLAVLVSYLAWRRLDGAARWRRECDAALLPYLMGPTHGSRGRAASLLAGGCVVLAALALAGPSWQRAQQQSYRSLSARLLVLDVSRSMDARDLEPSRMHRARRKLQAIIESPFDGQTGLVVFAGDAFTVSPLTDDAATLLAMLPALDTAVVPVQGSAGDRALALAARLLADGGSERGHVLLIGDGLPLEPSRTRARALRDAGYPVSVLGVGTRRGAPIPTPDGTLLEDSRGKVVVPRLAEEELAAVARAGGGTYVRISDDDSDLQRLAPSLRADATATQAVERHTTRWADQGFWLLPLLLLAAALGFRRGWLLSVPLLVTLPLPPTAEAVDLARAFQRDDQRAAAALARGMPQAAAAAGAGPAWTGAALYRSGDFESAADVFARIDDADGHYNRGNALARAGRLRQALEAYDTALARDPALPDARFNRELVRRILSRRQGAAQGGRERDAGAAATGAGTGGVAGFDEVDPFASPAAGTTATRARPSGQDARSARRRSAVDGVGASPREPPTAAMSEQEAGRLERWIMHIVDDPGGLLRRKFALQYRRRQRGATPAGPAW
jgi:Ca-activated chloride channel family protein